MKKTLTRTELLAMNPCSAAKVWLAKQPDLRVAWETCPDGGWMWWVLRKLGVDREISVKFAKFCAEDARSYANDGSAFYADYAARNSEDAGSSARYASDSAYYSAYAYHSAYASASSASDARKRQADFLRSLNLGVDFSG